METVIRTIDNFNFLKLVSFKDFLQWDVKRYLSHKNFFNYPLIKTSSFAKQYKCPVSLNDDTEYKRITVKLYGQGAILRDTELGKNIKTKSQFLVKKGQFIFSKIDARNGAFGIISDELDNAIITNSFSVYDIDQSKIIPQYLMLITTTDYFTKLCEGVSKGTTGRRNITDEDFLNFEIPLPSITEQEEILAEYNAKIQEAERLKIELQQFEEKYENTLFNFLGIKKIPIKQVTNSLQFVKYVNISRWGYQYLLNHEQTEKLLETKKYPHKLLSRLVLLNPPTNFGNLKKDDKVSFLPMECISDLYGEVIEYRVGDVQSSGGYTKFQEGDLLWSKITPCMQNGKSCIVENLENGFGYGSTEYHVIREKENSEIHLRFLYHILRTKYVLTNATFHFTGSAGQQRVPIEFLANLNVPLPSLDEQKEISKELDKLIADRKVKQIKVTELKEQAIKDFESRIFKT